MNQTIQLSRNVVLRHYPDGRFKKCALSLQFLTPMESGTAALNALLPAVLLRGTERHPDLRSITAVLDDLYGASVSTMVRRIGNIQAVGFYVSVMEDRFAFAGDAVLEKTIGFLRELMLEPLLENGVFPADFVESEKKNLISTIEAERNDKRTYASAQMLRQMCQGDSFAVPRLGRAEDVAAITPQSLYNHYRALLRRAPVEIFYVGSAPADTVAGLLRPLADRLAPQADRLPEQSAFVPTAQPMEFSQRLDVNQSKLSMGFTCGITNRDPDFAAMQVFNAIYGAGMTSKLFLHVREKLSLCYYASSGYYGSKGIVTVSSGIDECNYETARAEILRQLDECKAGNITPQELHAGKMAVLSSLRSTPDSPGALEGFYATAAISGLPYDIPAYMDAVERITLDDVVRAARTVELHTVFLLRGSENG